MESLYGTRQTSTMNLTKGANTSHASVSKHMHQCAAVHSHMFSYVYWSDLDNERGCGLHAYVAKTEVLWFRGMLRSNICVVWTQRLIRAEQRLDQPWEFLTAMKHDGLK